MVNPMMSGAVLAAMAGLALLAQHHEHSPSTQPAAGKERLSIPEAMQAEHHHLHEQLAAILAAGGKTAAAAKQVESALAPHFIEEETYAMPPLGLLPSLAQGEELTPEKMHAAIEMSEKLRANYKQMLAEHRQIVSALERLSKAAREENKPEAAQFAEALSLHARHEEQVLYPATMLIGDYLKIKAAAAHH